MNIDFRNLAKPVHTVLSYCGDGHLIITLCALTNEGIYRNFAIDVNKGRSNVLEFDENGNALPS
jgi:hypothetical protein